MLLAAGDFIRTVNNNRILWLRGRTGGGKTSLAFRLSYELMLDYEYRYMLSNVKNVWTDKPDWVVMRNGKHMDTILILDEAGEFVQSQSQADQWVGYMRKLNNILMLPSTRPPHSSVRFLSVQRLFSFGVIGIPLWIYKWTLDNGDQSETGKFGWYKPSEIYGVFDTFGYPDSAEELLSLVKAKVVEAKISTGYADDPAKTAGMGQNLETLRGENRRSVPNSANAGLSSWYPDTSAIVDIRGEIDALSEATTKAAKVVSLSRKSGKRRTF